MIVDIIYKAMANKITTTIRWDGEDLNDVKVAAKRVGLPVSLYVKSIVLSKVRGLTNSVMTDQILRAKQDLKNGDYDVFNDAGSFLDEMNTHLNEN